MTQEQYLQELNQGLDQINALLKDKPVHPFTFAANLSLANSAVIAYVPTDVLLKAADALKEAGVTRVDLTLSVLPWKHDRENVTAKYDALIEHLHALKVKIALTPDYAPAPEGRAGQTFAEWQKDALEWYPEWVRKYRPDVFMVVHEPTAMAARMKEEILPKQWAGFAQKAVQAVKDANPNIRCSVGLSGYERDNYLTAFLGINGLDILALDIFTLRDLKTDSQMIQTAQAQGKAVSIGETWRPTFVGDNPESQSLEDHLSGGIGNAVFTDLDVKWLAAMTRYASAWNLESLTPLWTQPFFLYLNDPRAGGLDPTYNQQVIDAVRQGSRTKTFAAYQKLAQTYGATQ